MRAFNLDITDNNDVDNIIAAFEKTKIQVEDGLMRALNKTALWFKPQSVKEISKNSLKQKLIRERLHVLKSNRKQ